jgi:hypothetical protein
MEPQARFTDLAFHLDEQFVSIIVKDFFRADPRHWDLWNPADITWGRSRRFSRSLNSRKVGFEPLRRLELMRDRQDAEVIVVLSRQSFFLQAWASTNCTVIDGRIVGAAPRSRKAPNDFRAFLSVEHTAGSRRAILVRHGEPSRTGLAAGADWI